MYVLPSPEIHLDERKRLHNEKGYALKFADKETYWLYGRKFDKPLWKSLVNKTIIAKELFNIKNMEQRMVAIKMMGQEWLLKESQAKLLDKSERGNELYLVENIFNRPAYFLKYKDSSTDRIYVSGIDPQFAKTPEELTADNAQAWKFQLSLEEYNQIRVES